MANHALYVNLLVVTKEKQKVELSPIRSRFRSRSTGHSTRRVRNATEMNIVLKKAGVLKPRKADAVK